MGTCKECKYVIHESTRYYAEYESRCVNPTLLKQYMCCEDVIDGGYLNNRCNTFRIDYTECKQFEPRIVPFSKSGFWGLK
jgi:hypothetical protein